MSYLNILAKESSQDSRDSEQLTELVSRIYRKAYLNAYNY
jgi:hypothetical protein